MRKRIFALSLILLVLFTVDVRAVGSEDIGVNGLKIMVDDNFLQVTLTKENDRVLVPFRAVFNALGIEDEDISWNGEKRRVTASKDDIEIELGIDDKEATINGEKVILDQPARLIEGKTMVPVRFVAESFNLPVDWDGKNKTVLINSEAIKPKAKQKINGPMPQESINGKSYSKGYGANFPELGENYSEANIVLEKDLSTGVEKPVMELLDDTCHMLMNVFHVDDTIWYVESLGNVANDMEFNLVVFNPETREVIKKPLNGLDIIRASNLENIDKTFKKIKKQLGPGASFYGVTSYGGGLAHTEDYVYMHFKFYVTIANNKNEDVVEIDALARVRKKDLYIDLLSEYASYHVYARELITDYNQLQYYDIDEYFYYVVELDNEDKIYRIAHDGYELERVNKK